MGNTNKHKIDRKITSKLPSEPSNRTTLRELSTLSECYILMEVYSRMENELCEFERITMEAIAELKKNGISFISEPPFHNPPSIRDAIECASFFLNFKVTSVDDIKKVFGDDSIVRIANNLGITTFKDNLNSRSSDSVLLFNIALLYCTNILQSEDTKKSIPFFILKERYQSLTDIRYTNDHSAFLFNVYNKIVSLGLSRSPFSSTFVSLYRAYEYFIIPSNNLIQQIIDARKNHSRVTKKYNDKYVENLNTHKEKIKDAQRNLLFYISSNLINWLNIHEKIQFEYEYECEKQDTLELLMNIMDKFKEKCPPHSLSGEYFITALCYINSNESINYFIDTANSLFTIKDTYMLNKFYEIIFHILGKHPLQEVSIDNSSILNHLYSNPITEKYVISLADFIYRMYEISDEEHEIIDTLLYSVLNNPDGLKTINSMILAYNPL